ncbi:helicase-related protein [bacterium]|nr:helicase-related protein [bacterium]
MFKSFVQDMRLFLPAEPKRKRGDEPDQNPAQPQRPRPDPDEAAATDKAARMRARVLDCPLFANRSFQYGPACAVAKRQRERFLVYYPLGSGKTLAALHAARTFLEMNPQGRIIILTTLSNVNTTWPDNIDKYLKHVSDKNNAIRNAEIHNVDWWFSQENQKAKDYNKLIRIMETDRFFTRKELITKNVMDLYNGTKRLNKKNKGNAKKQADVLKTSMKGRRQLNMLQATIPDKPYFLIVDECQEYINISARALLVNALANAAHTTLLLSATPLNDENQKYGLLRLMRTPRIESIKQSVLWTNTTSDKPTVELTTRMVKMTQQEWDFHQSQARAMTTYNQSQNAYLSKSRQACNCYSKWEAIANQLDADCLRFADAGGPIRMVVYSFFLEKGAVGFFNYLKRRNSGRLNKKTGRIKYQYRAGIHAQATLMNKDTLEWFNRKEKKQNCKILLLTSRSGMGISLKNVRAVHLMEPQWSAADEDQAVGRTTRKNSHDLVPRNVEVTRWLAVPPPNLRIEKSADQKVFARMKDKKKETDKILTRLATYGNAFLQNILQEFRRN